MNILLITKDNKLLLQKTGKELINEDSVEVVVNNGNIVIKLLEDYKGGGVKISSKDGEFIYNGQ